MMRSPGGMVMAVFLAFALVSGGTFVIAEVTGDDSDEGPSCVGDCHLIDSKNHERSTWTSNAKVTLTFTERFTGTVVVEERVDGSTKEAEHKDLYGSLAADFKFRNINWDDIHIRIEERNGSEVSD